MTLWYAVAGLILLALAPLLWPLLRPSRPPAGRLEHDIEVYRDQLTEVDADLRRGVISESEADEARREIERRILRAADKSGTTDERPALPSALTAVALCLALPGVALLIYGGIGAPTQPGLPFAERTGSRPAMLAQRSGTAPMAQAAQQQSAAQQPAPSLEDMAARLATKLETNPENAQDWALLGRTYWQLQRFDDAAQALRRAVTLRGDVPALQSAYGEALTQAAGGNVTPEALKAFQTALSLDGTHPAARFYIALASRQAGDARAAYDGWLDLIADLPADNPGRAAVLAQLQEVAAELDVDLETDLANVAPAPAPQTAEAAPRPAMPPAAGGAPARGPTQEDIAAAREMSATDRMAMIRSMVQGLADRLEESPEDPDGWARLGRAYSVLGERDKAIEAYREAARRLPAGSVKRQQVEEALQGLGG